MVFDEMLVKKSELKEFLFIFFIQKQINLQIIVLHYLGQRWSTVADASVDRRADNPF